MLNKMKNIHNRNASVGHTDNLTHKTLLSVWTMESSVHHKIILTITINPNYNTNPKTKP